MQTIIEGFGHLCTRLSAPILYFCEKCGVKDVHTTVSEILEPLSKIKLFFIIGRFNPWWDEMW